MSSSTHLGYGPFRLEDFAAGELFARADGTLARVCDPQPEERPEHVQVWAHWATTCARREWLHRTALAYAISEEQGWTIERRRALAPSQRTP